MSSGLIRGDALTIPLADNTVDLIVTSPPYFALRSIGVVTGCDGWADDCHEILSRARGGSITDPANLLALGRRCHTWITEHPREAERLGLSRSASKSGRILTEYEKSLTPTLFEGGR